MSGRAIFPSVLTRYGPPPRRLLAEAVRYKIRPIRFLPHRYRPPRLEPRHWWAVLVFPTMEALNDYGEWRGGHEDRDFAGMVMPMHIEKVRRGQPDRLRSKLGEILLWRERVGASVIAHEALHAALATLRMTGPEEMLLLDPDGVRDAGMENEERLCYMLGAIDRQIVSGLYRFGII